MCEEILKKFENLVFTKDKAQNLVVEINKDDLILIVKNLKDNGFDMLICVSGVDFRDFIEIYYFLYSTKLAQKVILKTKIIDEIESIWKIFKSADWFEREIFDLLGVKFANHPNLKRILLPEDWKGYPLRKNYVANDIRLVWND